MNQGSTAATSVVYRSTASRIALMYRLVSASMPEPRTLFLTVPGDDLIPVEGWDGDVTVDYLGQDPRGLRAYGAQSFDRVILHWGLERFVSGSARRRTQSCRAAVLAEATRLLAPGGTIAAAVSNWISLNTASGPTRLGRRASVHRAAFERSGLSSLTTHIVLPSADSPQVLVSTEQRAARVYFRASLAQSHDTMSSWERLLRLGLIESGVVRHLQGHLLVTGRLEC